MVFKRKIWRSMHTHLANVSLIGGGIYAAAAVTNCTSERNAVVNSTHSDIKFIWSFSVNTSSRALYSLIVDNSATVDELAPFIARNVSQPFSVAVAEYQQTVSTAGPFLITDQTGTNNDTYADLENIIGPKRDPFLAVFLMSIVYLLIMLTGTIGNLCTMYLISRKRYLHTATNYYLSSLAVSDLLLLLLGLPQDMVLLWQKYPYIFDESFCILRGWTSELSTNASILTITMFTIERFVAICYPLRRAATPKLGRVVKVIALCWCIAAICAAPIAMQFGIVYVLDSKQRPYPDSDHCAVKSLLYPYIFEIATMIFFVIPICIITILYILIGIRLRASSQNHRMQFNKNKNAGHQAKSRNCNKNGQIKQNRSESFEKRERPMSMSVRRQNASRQAVIKMLVAVVIAFFFCYSPFHAQRVLAIAMARNDVTDEGFIQIFTILTHISGVTYYLSATINPILYQLMSKKFQMALRETLPCCCKPFRDARNETVLAFSTAMTPSASPNAPSRAAPTATPITALTTPTIAIANTATAFSASSNQSSDSSSP